MLVLQFVFQTGPRVHCNRPQLDFHIEVPWLLTIHVFKRGHHVQNQVVAPVTIRLSVSNVVLFFNDRAPVRLPDFYQAAGDVTDKVADQPDPDGIMALAEVRWFSCWISCSTRVKTADKLCSYGP